MFFDNELDEFEFDIGLFRTDHLHNIERLKEHKFLFKNFLNNVVEACNHIYNHGKIVLPHHVLPEGNIYRVGDFPIQFDPKYWPVGFGKDDENELIFNSTALIKGYALTKDLGTDVFIMCRKFKTIGDIFLLNFGKNNFDKDLVYLINKCIIIPIIYLHNVENVEENPTDYYNLLQFLVGDLMQDDDEPFLGCTYDDIIDEKNGKNYIIDEENIKQKNIRDQLLVIKNIPGYDNPDIEFNREHYLSMMTVEELLQSWDHRKGTRNSYYNTDRLYAHYLGIMLDLIEQYYNIRADPFNKFKIVGAYFPEIPDAVSGNFPSEVLIRKKMILTPSLRNEIFLKTDLVDPNHKECNSSYKVAFKNKKKTLKLISKYTKEHIFDGGKLLTNVNKTKSLKKIKKSRYNLTKKQSSKKQKLDRIDEKILNKKISLELFDKNMLKNKNLKELLKFYLGID